MFHEVWIVREIMVFAVLEDEDAIFLQQPASENEVRDSVQFLQGVGRISEDEVKLLLA